MKRAIYKTVMRLNPRGIRQHIRQADGLLSDEKMLRRVREIFRRCHVLGASLILFDRQGITGRLYAGTGGTMGNIGPGTCYRAASISKMVSAALFVKAALEGKALLDADAGSYLGIPLRHPGYSGTVITPRMLLSHVSSLADGNTIETGVRDRWPLEEAVSHAAFEADRPGSAFHYSNLGAALCGEALHRKTGRDLDDLMADAFHVSGTYDAARLPPDIALADGINVVSGKTAFSADRRRKAADLIPSWCRAHGNLCISAEDLAEISRTIMTDALYRPMMDPVMPFGARDPAVQSGLGLFVIPVGNGRYLFGHQGLAYGACHGVFFSDNAGFVFLTAGCSLERRYVLSDINRALIRLFLHGEELYGGDHRD